MTKQELLEFLMPFTDEIELEVEAISIGVTPIVRANYTMVDGKGFVRFVLGEPKVCHGCRLLGGEHDFGPACNMKV